MNTQLAAKILLLFATLPTMAFASIFVGSYQPIFYYDSNIFDGPQVGSGIGNVQITDGAIANSLTLQVSVGSQSFSLPLVAAGNVATIAAGSYDIGTATIIDLALLSDGQSMALTYALRQNSGAAPLPISWAGAVWQTAPTVWDVSSLVGNWQTTLSYGNPNLRSAPFGLTSGSIHTLFSVTNTTGALSINYKNSAGNTIATPVVLNSGLVSLLNAPFYTGTSFQQVLNMTFDGAGSGAIFTVGTELTDPTDVSLTVTLASSVPEQQSYVMLLIGLTLVLRMARCDARRKNWILD